MNQLVVLIKTPEGRLFDSLKIEGSQLADLENHFISAGARVRNLDNIITVHFMKETGYTDAGMANLVRTFSDKYLRHVGDEHTPVITQWLTAIGAYSNLFRIETTVGNKIQVWLYSIGGWISSAETDPLNRSEMVELKQYILSKAGYLHGQKDVAYPIDEAWLKTTGMLYVAHVVNVDDLRQWPADMFRNGYVFFDAEHAYLTINDKVTSYNRKSVEERDLMLADWRAAGADAAPAPVLAEKPSAIVDLGTIEALALLPQDKPLFASLEAMKTHLMPPAAQVALQSVGVDNELDVYVNGVPFRMNVNGVVPPTALEHCENSFAMRALNIDTLPRSLFHAVYAQDAAYAEVDAGANGPTMVVTPYVVSIYDQLGHRRDFPREDNGNRAGFIIEFYSVLARMYPAIVSHLAHHMLNALQPALKYSVEQTYSYGEALVVESGDTPPVFNTQHFATSDFAAIGSFAGRLLQDEPASERGQLTNFQAVDELGILPETGKVVDVDHREVFRLKDSILPLGFQAVDESAKAPGTASERVTFDAPKLDLQGTLKTAQDTLGKIAKGKLVPAAADVNAENHPGSERAIEVPVVDVAGAPVYTAEFVFESPEVRQSALERGFLPLVSTALGSPHFDGNLLATARIGQLPHIACNVMETLGLESSVVYRRLR